MRLSKQNFYKKAAFAAASWFGAGYSPVASGTVGSLAALPVCWVAQEIGGIRGIVLTAFILFWVGAFATKEVLKYTKHDPSLVVIDEVVGQLLAFVFVAFLPSTWMMYLLGFVLFRFFDITKVWPACYFDRKVENAYGVMLDDVVAGLYAGLVLYAVYAAGFGF